jgi:hypothetical protein
MSGAEHVRSGSPDPLPVPPRHHKNGYREGRMRYPEQERHRSQRPRDYDRSHEYVRGEVRFWDAACECHPLRFDMTRLPRLFCQHWLYSLTFQQISRVNMCHVLPPGT